VLKYPFQLQIYCQLIHFVNLIFEFVHCVLSCEKLLVFPTRHLILTVKHTFAVLLLYSVGKGIIAFPFPVRIVSCVTPS